jgi:4-amino-4-deoxy-L-arabinose transferase-like glycosyltransferase
VESLAEKARKWTRSIVSESTIGALLLVFLLALGLRLAYVVSGQRLCAAPTYDGISYDLLATHLIGGQGYSLGAGQSAFRPPAYSFFLALLYLLVGRNYCAIRIAQALLGAFTPVLLYGAVARQFPGRRSLALLAAAGVVVHPLLIYMAGLIYPETLSIFLLALFWYLLARPASRWPYLQWAMGGCLLGLICLMRPNVLLLSVTALGPGYQSPVAGGPAQLHCHFGVYSDNHCALDGAQLSGLQRFYSHLDQWGRQLVAGQ